MNATGPLLRRKGDFPVLAVSQDYELFFRRSGSIDKCLFDPCELLLRFAAKHKIKITMFVDAGMLVAMERGAKSTPALGRSLDRIRRHIESIAQAGHEIGLHVHPHWEDAEWSSGEWQFANTRYQLRDFSDDEIGEIFESYAGALQGLCDDRVQSYRAGGFCIEPFDRIEPWLQKLGITIDSSVVPGVALTDPGKGFNFRAAPDRAWWRFSATPMQPDKNGGFLEIPVTPVRLPLTYYWQRLAERIRGHRFTDHLGDGISKAIGYREVVRRLAGFGLKSELSMDAPKAGQLLADRVVKQKRSVWHVMGHPKLLGESSLECLETFVARSQISHAVTLSELAKIIAAN